MFDANASAGVAHQRNFPTSLPGSQLAQRFAFLTGLLLASAAAGLIYSRVFDTRHPGASIVHGLFIGGLVLAFERGLILQSLHARVRNLPTLIHVPAAEATYVALIAAGNAIAGAISWATGLTEEPLLDAILLTPRILLYSLAVSATMVFVIRMRDLLGAAVFVNLLIGRYYRPVREERIFLFIDLQGSTAYAEEHGDLRAQEYLAAIFAALAEPVRRSHGAIDDYVGDMAMVTWPLAKGARDARCVVCVRDFLAAIERDAASWLERFGQVPKFRAALHGGPVVTAEVGIDRHKISHFGDVLNTTGRMEALCRALDAPILISSDLLNSLPGLPSAVRARPLGEHALKGRDQPLSVFALET